MPVQRIPRYRLLLQELYDHTPHSHPDYPCLKAALDEVSKRADEINERKRDYEQCTKVLELQKLIKGSEKIPLLQPHRRFVRDFSLRSARESRLQASKRIRFSQAPAVTIRHKRIDKEYRFFVFGDILLQCKVHGHLNKETELVRCIRLGGRRDQIELLEEENEVRIVDEDAIIYVTGSHNELVELMNAIATR
ncbi:Dbl homology domain-containing protein [Syncephalis fuscata]|nr:Dbl homology domain-containing protein [Syncephalis fuscata]